MERQPTTTSCYPGQFDVSIDPLTIAIPRQEIIIEMVSHGEEITLDRVCIAVAVVLDALTDARAAS
ncbi:MAG TPA: hypothetical protein VLA56_15920 [Pseudomonadales bacterium]|nr:hypothetical protein [Pseudomonadales bacterium]